MKKQSEGALQHTKWHRRFLYCFPALFVHIARSGAAATARRRRRPRHWWMGGYVEHVPLRKRRRAAGGAGGSAREKSKVQLAD